jgi:hypothetical protein
LIYNSKSSISFESGKKSFSELSNTLRIKVEKSERYLLADRSSFLAIKLFH